ncbi:protoheme IX farnesyltransferase [Peribacillus deserti]|uniref:Protoheme IX farnesyltransferase n=1 Tax=Peribacillus deserti TaxID=673318 RepID=A0ABS2QGW1_9BACI|nr:heme o synthase [Peribacillus deserti]MBM7692406.1 protoheme IX farnesyltransferase [Peribacillus deserti]
MSNTRVLADADLKDSNTDLDDTAAQTSVWKDFLSVIKIGIVNSNIITAFTGIWLALHFTGQGFLSNLDLVFLTIAGSAFVIAGSCALNNFIDIDIDPLMESKRERPTVTGRFSPKTVLFIGIVFLASGLIMLAFTTFTAAVIGTFGAFAYVVIYSMWAKRKLVSNTIIGSFSGAVPPLIGWAAVDPDLSVLAWMLFLVMFIWQPPHFYALAMKRCEEYRAAGIPMLPVVKGFSATKRSMLLWVAALLPLPFFMLDLGISFVILAAILNIGWLTMALMGYRMKDDLKWAKLMFVYSLNYLTILFVAMVIVTSI